MSARHVIITGPPGIGKTTLVQKLIEILREKNVKVSGFYTREVRSTSGERTGFQIVSTNGEIGTLASVSSNSSKKVGRYGVELEDFERISLPQFENLEQQRVLVIDEIGKMELFSSRFKDAVKKALQMKNLVLISTIPIAKGKSIPFVEEIRNHPDGKLFCGATYQMIHFKIDGPSGRPTKPGHYHQGYSRNYVRSI